MLHVVCNKIGHPTMQKFLALIFLTTTISCFGQQGNFNPFKLVIVSPAKASIDNSIISFVDTIQQDHLNSYYASIKEMEEMLSSTYYPKELITEKQFKETQQETKSALDSAKKYENKIRQFKYYQTISEYSTRVYQFYFNEYPPFSTFQLIDNSKLTINNLKHIADSLEADYVVGYKDIHTVNKNGLLIIIMTTILFSKKENKILLETTTAGDENSYGDMWTCSNPLSCLLVTIVKSSTDKVAEILVKRQGK